MMDEWIKFLQENDYLGIKKYLKSNVDVNESSEEGDSVLALALRYRCDDEIIDLLIDSGADLEDFNEDGVSILDYAIMYNKIDLTKKLLESGIDVNFTRRRSKFYPSYGRCLLWTQRDCKVAFRKWSGQRGCGFKRA